MLPDQHVRQEPCGADAHRVQLVGSPVPADKELAFMTLLLSRRLAGAARQGGGRAAQGHRHAPSATCLSAELQKTSSAEAN
mgnify:CR=1 FL=1